MGEGLSMPKARPLLLAWRGNQPHTDREYSRIARVCKRIPASGLLLLFPVGALLRGDYNPQPNRQDERMAIRADDHFKRLLSFAVRPLPLS